MPASTRPFLAALALLAMLTTSPASADVVTTFTGPWAPTAANGFTNAVQGGISTFTTSVSADGSTLTANLANNGDAGHPSFFLENYSFQTTPLLPTGLVGYDYTIELLSATGFVTEFDDFGRSAAIYASGTVLSGRVDRDYTGGYFSYFGINIDDFNGTARAIVTLSQFSAPMPEPHSAALVLLALGGAALGRRRSVSRA